MSLENYHIIESTLREGEQFIGAQFTREQKIRIAHGLDGFGVEYLELTSPLASPGCLEDVKTIVGLGLHARILTHIRCHKDDAKIALETGVDGLDVVIGTSSQLRQFSHGKSIDEVIDIAAEVLTFIRSQAPNIELRFSTEDSFRSEEKELLRVYLAVDKLGVVNRLGTADTVGIATPTQVLRLVSTLRRLTTADIEFHGHNDSGCAVANAFAALEGGATHIDTTVLGIGERNGITPLGGFVARMITYDRATVLRKYRLPRLHDLEMMVADMVGVDIPFNNCITGFQRVHPQSRHPCQSDHQRARDLRGDRSARLWHEALHLHRPSPDRLERSQGPRRTARARPGRHPNQGANPAHQSPGRREAAGVGRCGRVAAYLGKRRRVRVVSRSDE